MNEKKKLWSLLGVIGALCSIAGFFLVLTQILRNTLIEILLIRVSAPLWTIAAILVFAIILLGIQLSRRSIKKEYPSPLLHEEPHEITSRRKQSATPISSKVLQSASGSIATWVYLQPFGQGIRRLVNNRYIVAHDTNGGVTKQIAGKNKYVNVFSLSHGPRTYFPPDNPLWKLFLSNANGEGKIWSFEDYEELKPDWHHFLVRWDHGRNVLELLIDGRTVIGRDDYQKYWPQEYSDQILIGAWTNRATQHFIETWLWRTILSSNFLDNAWINRELAITLPPVPYYII